MEEQHFHESNEKSSRKLRYLTSDFIIIYMAWSSPPMLLAASLRLPEKYC
jgi:hypothetical protein